MQRKSISAHLGSTYSLKHNNREIMCANVDATRSCNNYYVVKSNHCNSDGYRYATIEEIYDKVFEPSWREFQSRQRPCRRYAGTYLEWIREQKFKARTKATDPRYKDKASNEAYEVVFQVGNMDDTGYRYAPDDARKAESLMKDTLDYMCSLPYVCVITEKELNDPNWQPPDSACLIVLNACCHLDEQVPAIHLTVVPCCISERGSKKQALFKKCFEQLGYPTTFEETLDDDGNRIPKVNKDNQVRTDGKGNIIYKKALTKRGALDWLDDLKDWCASRMRERYDWHRAPTTGSKRKHLDIEDYKVYRAKERQREIAEETEKIASETAIQSAVCLFNDKQDYDNMSYVGIGTLWEEYRKVSGDFWSWYRLQSASLNKEMDAAKSELDYYAKRQRYYEDLANRSGLLIGIIIKFITKALFGYQKDVYAAKVNELIRLRNELKEHSKKMAAQNANVRKQIANKQGDMQLINTLATTERQLREDYDKCVSRLIHGR